MRRDQDGQTVLVYHDGSARILWLQGSSALPELVLKVGVALRVEGSGRSW